MFHYTIGIVMYVVEAHYMPMNKLKLLLHKKSRTTCRTFATGVLYTHAVMFCDTGL